MATATLTSNRLTASGAGGRIVSNALAVTGSSVVYSVDCEAGTVGTATLVIYDSTVGSIRTTQNFTLTERERQTIRYDSWVSGNSCVCYIYVKDTGSAANGDSIKIYNAQLEVVDNQYNQNYSEFGIGSLYYPATPASIYVWGDSLSVQEYPRTLRDLYKAQGVEIWVHEGGVGGETSTQIATRMLAKANHYSDIAIIWAGRNNYSSGATVKADIASMIAALGHTRYLVLSVLNGSSEILNSSGWISITTLNADLAALYPSNYLDIRSLLVAQYNPSIPADVTDHANDIPPTSLRDVASPPHLNEAGYEYVAAQVKAFVTSQAWPISPTTIQ